MEKPVEAPRKAVGKTAVRFRSVKGANFSSEALGRAAEKSRYCSS